jgi:monoamine oxidase
MELPVAIVGAGVAGLSAAGKLLAAGIEPLILEAGDRLGGRVRALEGFADFPVELGAEEMHGADNFLIRMAGDAGIEHLQHFTTDDMVRLDGELCFLDQAGKDEDIKRAFDLIEGLGTYSGGNWTVREHLVRNHFPRRTWHYLDSRLGVEHGTTLERLAMRGFLHYEKGWEARETNYTLKGGYLDLFRPLITKLEGRVILNSPVQSIDWRGTPILRAEDGREWRARAVIVTASLLVLRNGLIAFDPVLPAEKIAAMRAIGMDGGMKIILKFHHRFWDERMYFLHTDGFLPQYWAAGKGKSEASHVLTAFVGGARAEELATMQVDPVRFALEELDELFGSNLASRSFENGFVADWSADPYVRGLYSYPTKSTTEADRHALARSLESRLFFAGEATDTEGHSGTVHGAMATGWRAAEEVIAVLG